MINKRELTGEKGLRFDEIFEGQLASGKNFDVDPDIIMRKLGLKKERAVDASPYFNAASDLYNIPRTGWTDRGISKEEAETVGEHTEAVTDLFYRLIDEIERKRAEDGKIEKLDREKMLKMIQVHDWPEGAGAGDQVVYNDDPVEEARLKEKKEKDEKEAMENICATLGRHGQEMMDLWLEYEANTTDEAQIVKQLDKLQVVEKAFEYEKMGKAVSSKQFIDSLRVRNKIYDPIICSIVSDIESKLK